MQIEVPPDVQGYIEDKVRSGEFRSPGDFVTYALDLLRQDEQREAWLRTEIQKGIDSLDRGEGRPWDVEAAKARLLERHAARLRARA